MNSTSYPREPERRDDLPSGAATDARWSREPSAIDTLGRVAYEAWWAIRKPDDYEVAAWAELSPLLREAWRAAADAVRSLDGPAHVREVPET